MNTNSLNNVIDAAHDAMGRAISDYWRHGAASTLTVRSEMFDDDEMPVDYLFRRYADMPKLERKALDLARGRVLDVGAGAGCHALELQERGLEVTAIDISPLSCEVMSERNIAKVSCVNMMDPQLTERFDTILLLMNGIGMAGTIAGLPALLDRLKDLMADGAQVLTDSSDLRYIFENEDGSMDIDLAARYYGEVDYQMVYADTEGHPFPWLYIDFPLLQSMAEAAGLSCELVAEGSHYDYLARITRPN